MSNRVIVRLPFAKLNVGAIKERFSATKDQIGDLFAENWDWIPWFTAGLAVILFAFLNAADFDLSRLYAGVLEMPHMFENGHFTLEGQGAMVALMAVLVVGAYVWARKIRR